MNAMTATDADELFRRPPHRHIDVGAGEVAYRKVGSGPDVLFVHGWPVSGATFRGLLPFLAPHVTCHVIDLVGAGQSKFDRQTPIRVEQHIESVRKVVNALELESYAVVGHDSGGMIARHALVDDARLRAMVLVDTEQPQGLTWRFRQFIVMGQVPGFEHILTWACMQRGLRRSRYLLGDVFHDNALLDGTFEEFFLAPLQRDPARRWAAGQLIKHFDERHVSALADVHARITVPVQLVWGADDPFFPVQRAREMVSTFSDARLHVVEDAKLFVHEERPEAVAQAMLPTLVESAEAAAV